MSDKKSPGGPCNRKPGARTRSKEEMMSLILRVAQENPLIRAAVLNGSRANPLVKPDPFQDYDVQFFVRDLAPFLENPHWIDVFGPRLILQTPEAMELFPPTLGRRFTYLMQFTDGNRVDLMLTPLEECAQRCREDGLTILLLDKDGVCPPLPKPSARQHCVAQPTEGVFADCCNEFWWTSTYVAKGLWRGELPYAVHHIENCVRKMLFQMMDWRVWCEFGGDAYTGKYHKYLSRYLPAEEWDLCLSTYACQTEEDCWISLFTLQSLMEKNALLVAGRLGFSYDGETAGHILEYLRHVKALPRDAEQI